MRRGYHKPILSKKEPYHYSKQSLIRLFLFRFSSYKLQFFGTVILVLTFSFLFRFVFDNSGHRYFDDVFTVEEFLCEFLHIVERNAVNNVFVIGIVVAVTENIGFDNVHPIGVFAKVLSMLFKHILFYFVEVFFARAFGNNFV